MTRSKSGKNLHEISSENAYKRGMEANLEGIIRAPVKEIRNWSCTSCK